MFQKREKPLFLQGIDFSKSCRGSMGCGFPANSASLRIPPRSRKPAGGGSSSSLTTFHVVMESGSSVRLHAIPCGPEATEAMEAGETRAPFPLAESVLNQAAEADRVELSN